RFGERAAEYGEVLREDVDAPSGDGPAAGDHAVTDNRPRLHAEVGAAVRDEHAQLHEGTGIEECVDALARGQAARRVLLVDLILAAAHLGFGAQGAKAGQPGITCRGGHGRIVGTRPARVNDALRPAAFAPPSLPD